MPYTVHPSVAKFMGKTVVDMTTGFKGVCLSAYFNVNLNLMFTVQPRVKSDDDSKLPEAITVDEHLLEIVEGGPSIRFLTPDIEDDDLFEMNDRVTDIPTGFTGAIIGNIIYLNGCIRYHVVPDIEDTAAVKTYPAGQYLDHSRLVYDQEPEPEVEDPKMLRQLAADPIKPYTPRPGGPMIRGGIPR